MRQQRWPTVELGSGSGVVGAFDGVALFVADGDAAGRLVDEVTAAVGAASPPGRVLARRLGALVAGDDGDVADFGVIAEIDDGWVVLLFGAVEATVTIGGTEETMSGTTSATWTDRIVPATVEAVLLTPAGSARPGASPLRLDGGVVPGGWLRVAPAATKPSTSVPAAFELFPLSPDGVDARPPLPVEGNEQSPDVPVAEGTAGNERETVAPETIEASAVEPTTNAAAADDRPAADDERATNQPVADDERVSLGLLVFDDGSAFGLDGDYVLGREPEIDESVVAGSARPIALDDPAGTVSRVHAEVRRATAEVQLIDRGSTNGTHLWDETTGSWDRLVPGLPRAILPGERGAVGRRTFVYEAPAPPPARSAVETVHLTHPLGVLVTDDDAVYPLDRSYVIGRDPMFDDSVRRGLASPIIVRDDQVSRVHAHVSVDHGVVSVRDAETVAGTFVAAPGASEWAVVAADRTELPPGWSLRVGPRVFTFRDGT